MGLVETGLYEQGTFPAFGPDDLAHTHQGAIPVGWQDVGVMLTDSRVDAMVGTTTALFRDYGYHGSPGLQIEAVFTDADTSVRYAEAGELAATRAERIRVAAALITRSSPHLYVPVWQGDRARTEGPYAGGIDVRVARLLGLELSAAEDDAAIQVTRAVVVLRNNQTRTFPGVVAYILHA
ncbi:MAG TPA: hypothetical protein VLE99_03480 [Candidatus Saccharimonadales bacterium]|nr:hypothetical protein [Candidatus Saccharimonadales bacterium]